MIHCQACQAPMRKEYIVFLSESLYFHDFTVVVCVICYPRIRTMIYVSEFQDFLKMKEKWKAA